MIRSFSCLAVAALSASNFAAVVAQTPSAFATAVVAFDTRGGAGGGIFSPTLALGAPQGGGLGVGSTHVHTLGIGGFLTLGFDSPITDGPGVDFLVAENPFLAGGTAVFAEAVFVEVSSDGVHFARFPSRYVGPPTSAGPLGVRPHASFVNLAGQNPVLPTGDPRDPVLAGGDAFDLDDLASAPEVLAGLVDLSAIAQVRLIDVRSGLDVDSNGAPIRDAESGSADIDGVTVLHFAGQLDPRAPQVAVRLRPDGTFDLELRDVDGLSDIDWASLHLAVFGQPIDPTPLLSAMTWSVPSMDRVVFSWPWPLPTELRLQITLSIRDRAGLRGADAATRDR
ncbi:MAG: hypothetical protein AB7I19_10015 [Planctomycetota bacterium]